MNFTVILRSVTKERNSEGHCRTSRNTNINFEVNQEKIKDIAAAESATNFPMLPELTGTKCSQS